MPLHLHLIKEEKEIQPCYLRVLAIGGILTVENVNPITDPEQIVERQTQC